MNFFEQQDQARQNTRWLIGLFLLAVLCIVLTVYAAVLFTLAVTMRGSSTAIWQPKLFWWVIFPTIVVITLGSLYKLSTLREGGKVVAQAMGGRLLTRDTADPAESQLLNVVDEMAIAAGISVPAVYVMDREQGINAFAAGFTANNAVVGVTRGTLDQLSRDELQGVIGHEFSHILNGDMALNLHLIALLNGILLLYMIGRIVLDIGWRSSGSIQIGSDDDDNKQSGNLTFVLMGLGIALMLVGLIGVFFGRVIKAAVSRQREFLADASAVQFTRNSDGIAGALRKIGGYTHQSRLVSPYAEENSHLFFGSALRFSFLGEIFATHPPLEQRIRRLQPGGGLPVSTPRTSHSGAMEENSAVMGLAGSGQTATQNMNLTPQQVVAKVGTVAPEDYDFAQGLIKSLPDSLQQAIRDPQGAIATVYALVLNPQAQARQQQIEWLHQVEPAVVVQHTLELVAYIDQLDASARLPLLDLTIPSLKQHSASQCERLFKCVNGLARADGRWSLGEFTLYIVLRHRLQPLLAKTSTTETTNLELQWGDCLLLLSALAQVGQKGQDAIVYAFRSGAYRLPGVSQQTLPETPPRCNFQELQLSLQRLQKVAPKLKQAIVDACAHTVLLDTTVTVEEAELMRAIAIALDCPLPPFLNSSISSNRRRELNHQS